MLTRYRQITLIAVLVSILMLCLTFAYWYKEFNASTEKRQQVFSASCDQTASIIHQRLSRYELMLRGVKGFYESSGFVTRAEYRDYVEALELSETIPGLLGVGVALHVPHEDKDRHMIEMQIRGIENYQIKPSGVRENYVLISLIEPYVGENLNAMGFDIYSNPATKSALTASQDSGEMALTEMLSLVQDAGKNMPAAVMYIPIYDRSMRVDTVEARRKAILGWVSGPFRINDLISSVGKQLDKDVDIEIYQGDTTSPSNLMYGKHSKLSNLHALRTVDIGGKRWTLAMHASPEFDARFSKSIPSLIAAGGIAFSLLFGWLIWLLGSGQARAVALAREMTDELWIAQKDLECTLNALPDILFELDLQGNYYQLHTSREAFLAVPAEELLGKNVKDVLSVEAANTCLLVLKEANETGFSTGKQIEIFVDNESRWFELSVARKDNGVTKTPRFIMISRDITDRKLSSNQLRIAAIAFESQEGMIVTDANHLVLRVNHSYTVITGYSADEVVGKPSKLFSSDRHDQNFYAALWDSINHAGAWAGEISDQRKNGEVYPLHLTITAVKDANNVVTNYVGTMTDITKSKAAIDEINTLAFYDSLTHLPNRRLLIDRLSQALAAHIRNHQIGALLFLDLDHFKTLNDTLGHDLGDLLLQQVAERLVTCIRECDTVARLGGDEFVVLLEGLGEHALSAAARVETIADKILHSLRQPYQLSVHQCHITISIGATLFNEQHFGVDELLKQADIAMYEAKSAGRNTLRFFDPKMQKAIAARVELEQEIRKAIDLQQFRLYYQVQVNDVGQAIGAEALIRWEHPKKGLIPPFDFVPIAEETGLIIPIGQWVLNAACVQLKRWEQEKSTKHLKLSINVSARQFHQVDFVDQVYTAVQYHSINPALLNLELTESMLLNDTDNIITSMNKLRDLGIRFELDDFGTGYSSLQYLKKLPLYQLKIDRTFVRDIASDSNDKALVTTIINMAHSLDLHVMAEGVETEEQLQFLKQNGCNRYQGYFFSKPLPIEQFEPFLISDFSN